MSDDDMNFSPIARRQWNTRTEMLSELSVTCHHVHKKGNCQDLSQEGRGLSFDCSKRKHLAWLSYKIKMIMNQTSALNMARGVKGYT